jgi:hypothetical protein
MAICCQHRAHPSEGLKAGRCALEQLLRGRLCRHRVYRLCQERWRTLCPLIAAATARGTGGARRAGSDRARSAAGRPRPCLRRGRPSMVRAPVRQATSPGDPGGGGVGAHRALGDGRKGKRWKRASWRERKEDKGKKCDPSDLQRVRGAIAAVGDRNRVGMHVS